MDQTEVMTYGEVSTATDFNRLPTPIRKQAAQHKYAAAVEMYASTNLTIREIADVCSVTAAGLSAHIAKHHRDLLFARYGIDAADSGDYSLKVKPQRGQSLKTHLKYKDAVEACGDIAYIEFNVSQVARMFNVNGTGLAAQLRVHYPEVIPNREKVRVRLGIADNTHRGPRQWCVDAYESALAMYRDTDLTIPEVADRCDVSKSGFCQFLRFYHKDVIQQKSARRKAAKREVGVRKPGKLSGNGSLYGPKPSTVERYAPALELYRDTPMTISQIVEKTGVPEAGFMGYLHQWHRSENLRPRGYLTSTAAKYAPAIKSLKENPRHVAKVAAEFGLNPEVFREYLKTHQPELAAMQGMTHQANGKLVKRSSYEKYAPAIREYATTAEPLKSIAKRHGIVYNSISGYVARNCPEERESHRRIVEMK